MPKKSKKSKSKRMTLKQKYKIVKKVKEHHRKKAKELKKKGNSKKKAALKDPGIPSQWPFKEELIKEFQMKRLQILAREKAQKEERKRQRDVAEPVPMENDAPEGVSLEQLQQEACRKQEQFDSHKKLKTEHNDPAATKDASRRAFYKEFVKVVEAADVIIFVLDARDPLACRCPEVEKFVRKTDPSKRIILLLNKIDLVPREVAESWLKYLREELPTIAFKCSTQKQASKLGHKKMPMVGGGPGAPSLNSSECLGAENLLQLLKNYSRNLNIKTSITVGIVGLPNVGKSSLINSLKRTRVAAVGNTAGVTRAVQEVQLDKNVKLLDSPGIVFASAESDAAATLRNAVKVERLEDPVTPVSEILRRCPAQQLMRLYNVPSFQDVDTFLNHVATARGKLKKGGTVDIIAAARMVLQDWNDGHIQYYTTPPHRSSATVEGSTCVVQQWGKEFNVDEVFGSEQSTLISGLPSLEQEAGAAYFKMESCGPADAHMEGMMEDGSGVTDSGAMSDDEGEEDEGGEDLMDEEDGPTARPTKEKKVDVSQPEKLYTEIGQFNPHEARARRKRQKKEKKRAQEDSDFEF